MRRVSSGAITLLLITSTLLLSLKIQPVRSSGTIYIRADGSIDPPTAPISTLDNITYVLTNNIYDEIIVERNNTIIDGKGNTLQGSGIGIGIDLSSMYNVTIKNTNIKNFLLGIGLSDSSDNEISRNTITNNNANGIHLEYSSNNEISDNDITANKGDGIYLLSSLINNISGNNVAANSENGIYLSWYSHNNSIVGNTITNTSNSIRLYISSDNRISRNNITNSFLGLKLEYSLNNSICENNIEEIAPELVGVNIGIELTYSSDNTISGNKIANFQQGLRLMYNSSRNIVTGNTVTENSLNGIQIETLCCNNSVSGNNVTQNWIGIQISDFSSGNTISWNVVEDNAHCVWIDRSTENRIFGNSFINNTEQIGSNNFVNYWDNGSIGNYWSDYKERYPNATEINDSGIWDTPYVIDENNQDNYPTVSEFPSFLTLPIIIIATLLAVICAHTRTRAKPQIHAKFHFQCSLI